MRTGRIVERWMRVRIACAWMWVGVGLASSPVFAAERRASPSTSTSKPSSIERADAADVLLRWGAGADEVGLRPAAEEFPAAGVEAVALAPDGSAWLLDRRNTRVTRVGGDAASFPVPADVVDLAVGADGTFAAYSQLRSKVFVFGADGAAAGELDVPRTLGEVVGLSVGASRQVFVHTAYQETFGLGSPSVPQSEASMRAAYREGAAFLPNGDGVSVVKAADGTLSLRVQRMGAERAETVASHAFAKGALSGVVAGVSGDVACVKVERDAGTRPFKVLRRVTCVDARSGRTVLDEALPARGSFLPKREVSVGGSPAQVVFIGAEREGLRVRRWPLAAGVSR